MTTSKSFLVFCVLILGTVGLLKAQTGVFWFGDSTSSSVNNKIISMKETPSGDIFLLGKASDQAYQNIHPYFAVCDKNGKLKSQKTIDTKNDFYELNNFVVCEKDKIRIWGTERSNGSLTISLNTINQQGEMSSVDAMLTTTTTLTGDVCQLDNESAIFAKTVQSSSTHKYHVSIYKYNIQTDQQSWYKTLATEDNEEASKIVVLKDGSIILLVKLYNEDLSKYSGLIYKLSALGEVIWKKKVDSSEMFYAQGISEIKNKGLMYVSSFGTEQTASFNSKLIELDSNGNAINTKEVIDIRANGILALKNGNVLLYGSHYQTTGMYIISKACYKIYNSKMELIESDEMGIMDGPDAYLPNLAISVWPTASDFVCAIQLADGRIACAGRVFMPNETAPEKIIGSERTNKAFLVLMDEKGKFRKQ